MTQNKYFWRSGCNHGGGNVVYLQEVPTKEINNMENKSKTERQYLNDFHKKSTEASLAAVERMSKQPLSREELVEQTKRKTKGTTGRKPTWTSLPKTDII